MYATKRDGELVFRVTQGALCALSYSRSAGEAVLFRWDTDALCDAELSEQARVLLRMCFEDYTASMGFLSLHASAVVHDGRAVCLTGPSGAGKTTLSKNWMKCFPQAYVLNGDRPLLQEKDGVFWAHGAPWSGMECIYLNGRAPLRAIVEVRQHCVNRLERLSSRQAYSLLLERVSKPQWNAPATGAVVETLARLVSSLPVYRFYCLNDPSAGIFLHNALLGSDPPPSLKGEKDMKVKSDYVVRKVLDSYIAVPVGEMAAEQGAIMLNEVGAFLWEKLTQPMTEAALLDCLLDEFDVDRETALADMHEFLDSLRNAKALAEE